MQSPAVPQTHWSPEALCHLKHDLRPKSLSSSDAMAKFGLQECVYLFNLWVRACYSAFDICLSHPIFFFHLKVCAHGFRRVSFDVCVLLFFANFSVWKEKKGSFRQDTKYLVLCLVSVLGATKVNPTYLQCLTFNEGMLLLEDRFLENICISWFAVGLQRWW